MTPDKPSPYRTRLADMRRERVCATIAQMKVLPSTVRVPMRLLELQRNKAASLKKISEVLMNDPALVMQTLSLANSAWFSPTKRIVNVSDAITMIGISNLMPMVFSASLAGVFNVVTLPQAQRDELWRVCVFKAVAAREWALMKRSPRAEEAFVCALLQDVAIPAMLASDPGASFELYSAIDQPDSATRELALYGATHSEFAAMIAKAAGLPEFFVTAAATHHDQDGPKLDEEFASIRTALQLAASIPHVMPKQGNPSAPRGGVAIGATPTELRELFTRVTRQFELIVETTPDTSESQFKQFMQQVCLQITDAVSTSIGQSNRIIEEMEAEVKALQVKADRADFDVLSGALNRAGFMSRAQQLLCAVRNNRCICGVGFADLDNFKRVNDEYGHDAGDRAIVGVSQKLREALTKRGLVGRFGGDEFVFIVTARTPSEQEEFGPMLEQAISGIEIISGKQRFTVSTSAGVFWLGIPDPGETIETALVRADQLMYQAKRSGKAQCVVAKAA